MLRVSSPASEAARIVAQIFQVPLEELTPNSSPDTIESWDSLAHLNLVLALEQEFGIQFTPEEIEELLSVELICALVEEKQKAGGVLYGG
jgi:acyl carrier protein